MPMKNFQEETLNAMTHFGKVVSDVKYVGLNPMSIEEGEPIPMMKVTEFMAMCNFEYDSGYGGQIIQSNLMIVFSDGSFMTRGEYDGSEWWTYTKNFVYPLNVCKLTTLKEACYDEDN